MEKWERSEEAEEHTEKKVLPHHKQGQACVFSQRIVYWLASSPPPYSDFLARGMGGNLREGYWVFALMHDWADPSLPQVMWGL